MSPRIDMVYVIQLHAQTPRSGNPKITVRIPSTQVASRALAEAHALRIAETCSLHDMGWVVTKVQGPIADRGDFKPPRPPQGPR